MSWKSWSCFKEILIRSLTYPVLKGDGVDNDAIVPSENERNLEMSNPKNAIWKINALHLGYTLTSLLIYSECAEGILHQRILAKRIL